jgi:hypothetical protein
VIDVYLGRRIEQRIRHRQAQHLSLGARRDGSEEVVGVVVDGVIDRIPEKSPAGAGLPTAPGKEGVTQRPPQGPGNPLR